MAVTEIKLITMRVRYMQIIMVVIQTKQQSR